MEATVTYKILVLIYNTTCHILEGHKSIHTTVTKPASVHTFPPQK